ncbi:MAG: hypothetical protein M1275_03570 [Patescibacteria group bacterium]|nr:hypothetical protein [Patescibacteria group bacterium]
MLDFYEVKYQISRDEEPEVASSLGLMFTEEYTDLDIYLKTRRHDSFKLKVSGEGTIFYQIKLMKGVFVIMGKTVDQEELQNLMTKHPIEIEMNRINRVYAWKKFMVKCDFDYIKQFPDRAFLKVYSISREPVEEAKQYLSANGFSETVDLPYNKLYWHEHPEFKK